MRKILVLGAGHSAPYLVSYLLEHARELDAEVTVADADADAARALVGDHERGRALGLDVHDEAARERAFAGATVVASLLPPPLQPTVAELCLRHRAHMVSASYRSPALQALADEARERGVALLCELGLDPGIDLMAAQRTITGIQRRGGTVASYRSYGGGLPEPAFRGNPLRYCVTWNPRNVAMAAADGAQYLDAGRIRLVPHARVFESAWEVEVPELGTLEAYPNRDSLAYREIHGLDGIRTLVRGTLRYPGFSALWHHVVRLGLPNERLRVPDLAQRSLAELVDMLLPTGSGPVSARAADFLGLEPDGEEMLGLEALGLFSDEPTGARIETPAGALTELLERRLPLPAGTRDLVVLHHEIEAVEPSGERREVRETLVAYGEPGGFTAMARSVGLPAALGARLLLEDRLELRGVLLPTAPEIYEPVLEELGRQGLELRERPRPEGRESE